jgi:hypothetical protein
MSQLSELTAAERTDVLPGYVLSPPRLREHGVAEDSFARWYIERVERGTRRIPSDVRRAMLDIAVKDMRDGYFTVGQPGYDAFALSARGTRLMFWLSLRIKHPQITHKEAGELFDKQADEKSVTDAVFALWGYERAAKQTERSAPIDWQDITDHLCGPRNLGGREMTLEEMGNLTLNQLMVMMGGSGTKTVGPGYVREKAKLKQREMLARICEMKSLTPAQLGRTSPEVVAAYVRELIGNKPFDMGVLKDSLTEYAKAK